MFSFEVSLSYLVLSRIGYDQIWFARTIFLVDIGNRESLRIGLCLKTLSRRWSEAILPYYLF